MKAADLIAKFLIGCAAVYGLVVIVAFLADLYLSEPGREAFAPPGPEAAAHFPEAQ